MNLDLTDDEAAALLRELDGLIDGDREAETAGGTLSCPDDGGTVPTGDISLAH